MKKKMRAHDGNKTMNNLAKLTAVQVAGIIVVEILVVLLIALGLLPPTLKIVENGVTMLEMNTVFLVVAGMIFVLVSAFWTAILVETTGVIEIQDVDLRI